MDDLIRCTPLDVLVTTKITPFRVTVEVALPYPVMLFPSQAEQLECNLHSAVELVLAPYFRRLT